LLGLPAAREHPRGDGRAAARRVVDRAASLDRPPRVGPEGVAELALEDLARVLSRELVAKLDLPGDLVARDPRTEKLLDLVLGRRLARAQIPQCVHGLAELLVRDAEHRTVG